MIENTLTPVLLFGGPSAERLVSVASAQNVLASASFPLDALFIDSQLRLHAVSAESVLAHRNPFTVEFQATGDGVELDLALARLRGRCAIIALHGTWGEDGSLQERLDHHGITYTGSDARACRLAFDKTAAKALMAAAAYRVPQEIPLDPEQSWESQLPVILGQFGPFVLKPVSNGSSIGLHMIKHAADLAGLVPEGKPLDFIAETMIQGREFTVGVVEGPAGLNALPVSEICMARDSNFDYSGKYLGQGSTEITPARIDAALANQLGEIAQAAHGLCGCRGYSRTDILLDETGPVFLEINTHPGLSKASFIPQQLAAAGLSFADFLSAQIDLARSVIADRTPLRQ